MRELNTTELNTVNGGCCLAKHVECKPVVKPASSCNPLSYILGFLGGAIKLLTTGVPSTGTGCGCGSTGSLR